MNITKKNLPNENMNRKGELETGLSELMNKNSK